MDVQGLKKEITESSLGFRVPLANSIALALLHAFLSFSIFEASLVLSSSLIEMGRSGRVREGSDIDCRMSTSIYAESVKWNRASPCLGDQRPVSRFFARNPFSGLVWIEMRVRLAVLPKSGAKGLIGKAQQSANPVLIIKQ